MWGMERKIKKLKERGTDFSRVKRYSNKWIMIRLNRVERLLELASDWIKGTMMG